MWLSQISDQRSFHFHYSPQLGRLGSRIGGKPPHGAVPLFESQHNQYFGTIGFDEGCDITIFYSLDRLGSDPARDILHYNNRILLPSVLIQAVAHKSAIENPDSLIAAEVSSHSLAVDPPSSEPELVYDDLIPYPKSKFGGIPFADNVNVVGNAFTDLSHAGYRLLAQFDTPHPRNEHFVNNFPWDPGWLHVFFRGTFTTSIEFAFVIQQ